MDEQPDDFEVVLDFCIEKMYRNLKNERAHLREKLIDRSFADEITDLISELYIMKADIKAAYRNQMRKSIEQRNK